MQSTTVPMALDGKVALITGGSRGIGAAAVRLFRQAGARVAFNYRSARERAEALAAECGGGAVCRAFAKELDSATAGRALVEETIAAFGRIDCLVVNHGIWPPDDAPIATMDGQQWRRTMDVNLDSVFGLVQAAVGAMQQQAASKGEARGHIVLVSSTAGQRGEAFHADYAVSKGALISLTKSLSSELAPQGVYVNCVAPGWVDTEMAAPALATEAGRAKNLRHDSVGASRTGGGGCRAYPVPVHPMGRIYQRRGAERERWRGAGGMTIRRVGLLFVWMLCGGVILSAQATGDATANAEQQKVKTLLQQMIQALGGDAWLNAPGYELVGRTSGFYQSRPTGAIADFFDYRQLPDKERVELGKKRQVYEIYIGDQGWEITYRGKRAIPKIEMDDYLRRRDHSVDAAARVWMKDPGALYLYGGQEQVERHLADKITILSSTNDNLTLDLDANSHLPVRRSFEWRDPLYKDKNIEGEEYDDYHKFNGISTPFSTTRYHNGDMTNQRFLYNVTYGGAIPPDMFDVDAAVRKLKK